MIKIGIAGAGSPVAGELIRILALHPEIEITEACEPALRGRKLASVHRGLIGETELSFTDNIRPDELDVIFICERTPQADIIVQRRAEFPELKIIDLTGTCAEPDFECGLSEINRKPLVRGARCSTLLSPVASAALVALYPLAANLLLSAPIEIKASLPDGMDAGNAAAEIERELRKVQNSFNSTVTVTARPGESPRGLRIAADIPTSMTVEDLLRLYEGIYDDHNFTFMVSEQQLQAAEAEGTQRCLISVTRRDAGSVHIEAVADARMRGGAGDAVHVMNLLFGLYERTGLAFKTCIY